MGKKEGKLKREVESFFFFCFCFCFCFFFLFCFSLLKTTEIFFGQPKWKFPTGKSISHREKKSGKMTLPPQKNFPVTPLIGFYNQKKCRKSSHHHSATRGNANLLPTENSAVEIIFQLIPTEDNAVIICHLLLKVVLHP